MVFITMFHHHLVGFAYSFQPPNKQIKANEGFIRIPHFKKNIILVLERWHSQKVSQDPVGEGWKFHPKIPSQGPTSSTVVTEVFEKASTSSTKTISDAWQNNLFFGEEKPGGLFRTSQKSLQLRFCDSFLCVVYLLLFAWWFKVTFLGWLSGPFKGLSDLQLGDEKVTLNHLVMVVKLFMFFVGYLKENLAKGIALHSAERPMFCEKTEVNCCSFFFTWKKKRSRTGSFQCNLYGCFGLPPKSSHFNRVFHYKSSILEYPYILETPIFSFGGFLCFFFGCISLSRRIDGRICVLIYMNSWFLWDQFVGRYTLGVSPTHQQWNNNLFIFMKGPL